VLWFWMVALDGISAESNLVCSLRTVLSARLAKLF
jgi:hypothetical protein